MANTAVFLGAGFVTPGDALSGDGSILTPLDVLVDGSTIDINGSNQLEAINTTEPGGADTSVQYNNGGAFGGFGTWDGSLLTVPGSVLFGDDGTFSYDTTGGVDSNVFRVGIDNDFTTDGVPGYAMMLGDGNAFDNSAADDIGVDQLFIIGASLDVTFTQSGGDLFLFGEHMFITDEFYTQQYGLGMGGGGADINVKGGEAWTVIAGGVGNNDLDFFHQSLAIGGDIDFHISDPEVVNTNWRQNFLIGRNIDLTDSGFVTALGQNIAVNKAAGGFSVLVGAELTVSGTSIGNGVFEFGTYLDNDDHDFVFLFGDNLTATDDDQTWFGSASNAVFFASGAAGFTFAGGPVVVPGLQVTMQTPASAGAAGVKDTIAFDTDYIYICTATNTWKRVAIATWP